MIEKIISGGQTGADQAGWRAARRFGIPTGGWMPRGFLTENGKYPEFRKRYGAREHPSQAYPERTRKNVEDSSGTLIFAIDPYSSGTYVTVSACEQFGRPFLVINPRGTSRIFHEVIDWYNLKVSYNTLCGFLNIAGNRESKVPGIGQWVENYLCEIFRITGYKEIP